MGISLRVQLLAAAGALVTATVVVSLLAQPGRRATRGPGAVVTAGDAESSCAGPRWPVKTMADGAAARIDLLHPQATTVAELRSLSPPTVGKRTARQPGFETRTVKLTADLISARVSPDGDLAVVVSAPGRPNDTMTTEFPASRCLGPSTPGPARDAIATARRDLEQGCGQLGTAKTALGGSVTLTGVVFIDTPHQLKNGVNARQAAPNEVELHPVTRVQALSCRSLGRSPEPVTSPTAP